MDLRELKNIEQVVKRHPWEIARVNVVKDILTSYFKSTPPKEILDIGCGDTFVIDELSKKYQKSNFHAIDIAFEEEQLEDYKERYKNTNINVYNNIDNLPVNNISEFSLILLLDVVEHIEHDVDFLRNLFNHPKITENTLTLITVPAFQKLFCQHDVFLGHYRRYTNASLKKCVEDAGWSPINMGYFFTSLLMARSLQIGMDKLLSSKDSDATTGLVEWQGGKIKSNFISHCLTTDYKFSKLFNSIGLRLPGLSNYIVCKKSA